MSTETDGLDTIDTAEWAAKLARGDGQGLVPIAVAQALWGKGLITTQPQRFTAGGRRRTHVMVYLTEEARP